MTGPPYEVDWVDPSTGQFTKIVDFNLVTDGRIFGVLRNDNTVVYPIQNNTLGAYFAMVEFSTGKIQVGKTYPGIAFFDVQFDKVTDQTFAYAISSSFEFGVVEVLPDQTLLMAKLPEGSYSVPGAYSSSKHIYFLMSSLSNVLAVSTVGLQKGTILYNVRVGFDAVGNLMYDDTFGVLYVWGYNNKRTILASVDYTTGKTLKTFFTSPNTVFGPTCIDKAATTVYSSLFDKATSRAMIHSVDLASGEASEVPTAPYAMTMNCL